MTHTLQLRALLLGLLLAFSTMLPARAQVSLDLRDADIKSFVQIVAEATGRRFILDPDVRGTVTVIAPGRMTEEAVYEIFLNVLELNRLTIVEGNEADRIVQLGTARGLAPGTRADLLDGAYETRVISVRNAPLSEITEVVRPLLPQEAVLSTVPSAGLIILSDRAENFRRIDRLIQQLDQSREQPIEMISLRNANATEMLQVIDSLEITPPGAKVSADRRGNALLVSGSSNFRQRVRSIVTNLDQPQRSVATRVVQLNYADANSLGDIILRSFGSTQENGAVNIVAEPRSNALIVTAPNDRINEIVASIHNLDRRPHQVLVEAVIFEMSVQGFSDLSVQFGAVVNDALAGGVQFALQGRPTLTSVVSAVINDQVVDPGSGGTLVGRATSGEAEIVGFLQAVATQTSTRLLSTPSILTLNNQEAEIVVAQNVPFITGSFSTTGDSVENPFQTIERQDVGLTLKVTPTINADSTVRMAVSQEVSNLTNTTSAAGGEITAKRTLSTNVLVRDGNVIMLGGLLEDGSGANSQKVPGLGDTPLIGGLFRGKNVRQDQRVLLVLLRPRVVANDKQAEQLTREVTRESRRASLALQPLDTGQYPRTPDQSLPFDGADLNQPFDAGFVDDIAKRRKYPPLPSRLQFNGQ
ncbi:secretin N-terminal domain-containing protein [Pseudoruegeria sp. SHC-113]|uniref:secretin N-terminal domain-containing protein n=1 Tax=Pseudoruegeria sp. SHC-113 TaxID=2855439 RepID=UPI0021BB7580|nr:secretin N-terminal domain-containing protein [Pseudoruegeria sp. SHC-113]MCT8161666.1 type II secretion system protein GspD [Pseudoruegeria sp. SHC-113]